ncbi:uncharacterized protein [Eleutherodactylus coqui]|uniref:uncharacterized protein n=1 Tax=Eleutherodactylus coqui TaxID=57060 RepID=UPI003462A926
MEDLLRQLVIRAEPAGGEEWLCSCLTLPLPSVSTPVCQPGVLKPEPEDPVINMGAVEQEALEGAEQDVLELSATVDPGLYAPEGEERPREITSQKRQRKRTRAYTPPRRRSARRRAAQKVSQSRGGSLAGAVRVQGAGEGTSNGPMRTIVWIVGHSFVFWAKQRAAERCYSELLGLNNELFVIYWAKRRGPMRTIVWIVGHSFVFWAKQRAAERCYSELLGLNNELFVIYWAGRRADAAASISVAVQEPDKEKEAWLQGTAVWTHQKSGHLQNHIIIFGILGVMCSVFAVGDAWTPWIRVNDTGRNDYSWGWRSSTRTRTQDNFTCEANQKCHIVNITFDGTIWSGNPLSHISSTYRPSYALHKATGQINITSLVKVSCCQRPKELPYLNYSLVIQYVQNCTNMGVQFSFPLNETEVITCGNATEIENRTIWGQFLVFVNINTSKIDPGHIKRVPSTCRQVGRYAQKTVIQTSVEFPPSRTCSTKRSRRAWYDTLL